MVELQGASYLEGIKVQAIKIFVFVCVKYNCSKYTNKNYITEKMSRSICKSLILKYNMNKIKISNI